MRFKRIHIVFVLFVLHSVSSWAVVTNPAAQALNYSQNFSTLLSTSTTYPTGWQGWQLGTSILTTYRISSATVDQAMIPSGTAASTTGGIYNYNGKIGFLQSTALDPSICFAINTTGLNGINVAYDIMTIRDPYDGSTNTRINEVTLQYRVGTAASFISLTGIEYQNNGTAQTGTVTTPVNSQTKTITLPSSCDNQAVVQLRWVARDISGGGSRASFAFDNIAVTSCTTNTSTYYYRSLTSGSWNTASTWEASLTGISGWITACTPPTNAAAAVTILNGHTVTIDATSTAPDITINSGGTLQSNSTVYTLLTISGNLINNGTLQMVGGSVGVNVTFNKNGNQTITGTGTTTNFYCIGLSMGTSTANILDISPTNFSSASALLTSSTGTSILSNGTIRFSGSYTYSNKLFNLSPSIPATAGIWLNNPNVTVLGANYSYNLSGLMRITSGAFNVGSASGNSLYLLSNSKLTVEGGTLTIAARLDATTSGSAVQSNVAYRQSAGTVTLTNFGPNTSSSLPDFFFTIPSDSLIMSGGILVFKSVAPNITDLYHYGTSVITGGTIQFANSTTGVSGLDFEVLSPSPLPSIVIDNSSGTNPYVFIDTTLTIIGSITLNAGTTLDNSKSSTNLYDISLTGSWNNSGIFVHNNKRTVIFNGSSAQNITGVTSTGFHNLTINNSSGGVTLLSPASVIGLLTLTNGFLYTDNTNILTMTLLSSVSGATNSSFVYGPMKKTGTTDFIFPVGKDLEYRPIAATSLSASETFTAEYFHIDPNTVPYDVTLKDPTLNNIGRCEYWILNRAGSANANVTLSWDTYSCGVTSLPDLSVARWDSSLGMWKDQGNGGTTGTTSTGTVISNGLVTSFSPFTLASKLAAVNPLPVELLTFTANYTTANTVALKWSTASEKNNAFFTIERSADAEFFDELMKIDGAGNSSRTLFYSTIDPTPLNGVSYYRLKQTDFNGDYKYSGIISIQTADQPDFEIISTVNSFEQNGLAVLFSCNADCVINFELIDMTGKQVYSSSQHNMGTHSNLLIPTDNLSHGIYLLRAFNGNLLISKKIKL